MQITLIKPPVLKIAIDEASSGNWAGRPLTVHLPELEKLLMVNANAPMMFDDLPMLSAQKRSAALVGGVQKSFASNPDLRPMVLRVGAALKDDRAIRNSGEDVGGVEALVASFTRQIEVKPAYRPRG
jgi:hypothetical protein